MRKKQFGKLLTVSLSEELYGLVEEISSVYRISMSEVVRNSIEHSVNREGAWISPETKRPAHELLLKPLKEFSGEAKNEGDRCEDNNNGGSLFTIGSGPLPFPVTRQDNTHNPGSIRREQ